MRPDARQQSLFADAEAAAKNTQVVIDPVARGAQFKAKGRLTLEQITGIRTDATPAAVSAPIKLHELPPAAAFA